jgi:hypothetical protein
MRLLNDVTVLDLSWSGPHSFEEIASFNDSADHGVYQIYGTHNVTVRTVSCISEKLLIKHSSCEFLKVTATGSIGSLGQWIKALAAGEMRW